MAKAELVLIGTDDGVVLLSNPGGIGRWLKSAHALRGEAICATWAHPNDPTQLLCSSAHHLWRSVDGGQTWGRHAGPACQRIIASRSAPERIWACDGQTAYQSLDAGTTWQAVGGATHIAGGGDALWYGNNTHGHWSTNGGIQWHATDAWQSVVVSHDGRNLWYCTHHSLMYHDTVIDDIPHGFIPLVAGAGAPCIIGQTDIAVWRYADTWHTIDALSTHMITAMTSTIYHPDRGWAGDAAGNVWYSGDRYITWELVRSGFAPVRALSSARLL